VGLFSPRVWGISTWFGRVGECSLQNIHISAFDAMARLVLVPFESGAYSVYAPASAPKKLGSRAIGI
jgi:hypothetical protein